MFLFSLSIIYLLCNCRAEDQPALCKYRNQDPGRHCIEIEELITSDDERHAVLDKINSRRNKVAAGDLKSLPAAANMPKLEWSSELEASAKKWANQCVKTSVPDIKDACRHLPNTKVGQNIATILGESPGLKPTTLVDVWYMELLHINSSVLVKYRDSRESGLSHYDYFTQLMWSETREVGCGSVKFKERIKENGLNRTVYRLVCNFAPEGNRLNQSVYVYGSPCSRCPKGTSCDPHYKALCGTKTKRHITKQLTKKLDTTATTAKTTIFEISKTVESPNKSTETTPASTEEETYTPFDYFSHLHEFTRQAITTTAKTECKDVLAVDDFIDLLRKKLSSDSIFKDLIFSSKYPPFNTTENSYTDPKVAAFVNKIYSKKQQTTTTRTTEHDLLNSTFLVDLVEAVIFRSGDRLTTTGNAHLSTQDNSNISPIKIQAELGEIQQNSDFTGHYFFPEDDVEYTTTEPTEIYYDSTSLPTTDVMLEIADFRKTSDFLEQILELDSSTESTATTVTTMLPDVLTSYQSGRNIMKKFLEEINQKST